VRNLSIVDPFNAGDSDSGYPGIPPPSVLAGCSPMGLGEAISLLSAVVHEAPMTKAYEGDYEFGEAAGFANGFRSLVISGDQIKKIADTWMKNLERVLALAEFPLYMAKKMRLDATAYDIARARLGIPIALSMVPQDRQAEYITACEKAHAELRESVYGTDPEAGDRSLWSMATFFLKEEVRRNLGRETFLHFGIEAVFGAMLMNSYSAFEVMAADLWIALVNADPGAAKTWAKSTQQKPNNPEKTLTISDLAAYDFDLRKVMGTILAQEKVEFDSLEKIKAAYKNTFHGATDSYFTEELKISEQVRHLFAHSTGIVDSEFISRVGKHYPQLKPGDKRPLDGVVVCKRLDATVKAGNSLLLFGDKRLANTKK